MRLAPRLTNISPTADLPLAMPPVRPSFNNDFPGAQSAFYVRQFGLPDSTPQLRRFYCIRHQHGNGQWAHASRNRSEGPRNFRHLGMNIPNQRRSLGQEGFLALLVSREQTVEFFSIGNPVDADIDHRRSRLYEVAGDHTGAPDRRY